MRSIVEQHFLAIIFFLGASTAVLVLQFPWFSFLATILLWTAMRAPKTIGVGHVLNVKPARTVSDAAYEGLWAAVTIVAGVTVLFEAFAVLR
ncbi:MAG: hypothetical protein AAFW68_04090 [Pseudomonadota bacterium]